MERRQDDFDDEHEHEHEKTRTSIRLRQACGGRASEIKNTLAYWQTGSLAHWHTGKPAGASFVLDACKGRLQKVF